MLLSHRGEKEGCETRERGYLLYEYPRRCSLPGRNAVRAACWEGILQGFSGLVMLEIEAWGQGSSGKSGCIDRVKSTAPGKEDRFLQTHGVTLTLLLGHSGTAVVTWLAAHKTKVTFTVTGESHREPRGQIAITRACLHGIVLPARRCPHWARV